MESQKARGFETVPMEAVRSFWNARPCNIRYSPKQIGTEEYFSEVEARKYFVGRHILRFAEFERWRGKKVLEIGCGIGTDTINFARHGAFVTAIDISDQSLEVAMRRAEVFGLQDRIRFVHANSEDLRQTLSDETYDLVFSFGVIHHTPHPGRVLQQIRRYVKPGSTVKIMVYHRYSWKVLWILLVYGKCRFWHLEKLVAQYSEAQEGCPVTYIYTRAEGRRLLEEAGFRVREVSVDHIFPYRIPDYVQYRYEVVWYFRWLPKSVFRWLERRFGWHLCLTADVPES